MAQGAYDRALDGYERERCRYCGGWYPWPAMDTHACDGEMVVGPAVACEGCEHERGDR